MNTNFIILFLIAHILGDFYLQTENMAKLKNTEMKWLFIHSSLYSIPYIVIYISFDKNLHFLFLLLALCSSHLIIDFIKSLGYRCYLKCVNILSNLSVNFIKQWMIYLLDQIIHILIIIIICYLFKEQISHPILQINNFFSYFNLNTLLLLKWILIILSIYKPANITFIQLFSGYKPTNSNDSIKKIILDLDKLNRYTPTNNSNFISNSKKAGAIIGFLERIVIIILLSVNQYSSIGLILTAKSIARYDMISKDQEFAEYYLIGTLFSVLFSIVLYVLLF